MFLYIAVAIWPILMAFIFNYHKKRTAAKNTSKNIHILLALLPMFILIALRSGEIGADTGGYIKYFNLSIDMTVPDMLDRYRLEEGYILFINFLSTFITKNPLVYQIIYTSVYLVCIWDFCCQMEDDDAFLFSFFFATLGNYMFMFTGVRQCIAMSLCLLSYRFVRKRKIIPFLIIIALAFTFHRTAILFLAVYFISGRKVSLPMLSLYTVGTYLVITNFLKIYDWFSETFEYSYDIEVVDNGIIFLVLIILLTVFSFVVIWDAKLLNNDHSKGYLNLSFIAIIMWILRQHARLSERLSYYFLFFVCALVAYAISHIRDRQLRFISRIVIIAVCLILYIYRLSTNFASFVPYKIYG